MPEYNIIVVAGLVLVHVHLYVGGTLSYWDLMDLSVGFIRLHCSILFMCGVWLVSDEGGRSGVY